MKRKRIMENPELIGLMARLPLDTGWTQTDRAKFLRTFEIVLDYVIPVTKPLTEPPPEQTK